MESGKMVGVRCEFLNSKKLTEISAAFPHFWGIEPMMEDY